MKTKEVIRLLMEADPSGEEEVCVGNSDIHFIENLPAYYDGSLQVLQREGYKTVGAKYKRTGRKIKIHSFSIHEAISNDNSLVVDYSELSPEQAELTKKAHNDLREFHRKLDFQIEQDSFVKWAKEKAEKITADTDDFGYQAMIFYERNLSPTDPFPQGGIPLGQSVNSTREMQWDERVEVCLEEGFLEIKIK